MGSFGEGDPAETGTGGWQGRRQWRWQGQEQAETKAGSVGGNREKQGGEQESDLAQQR